MDLDWSIAPSSAHSLTNLVLSMMKDESINPFVYEADHFTDCIQKVKDLTDNVQRKVLVTDKNITEVFRYFDEKVLVKNKFTTNERANLFVQILVNKDDNYLHPVKKRKTIVSKSLGEVSVISREAFESFFNHFSSSYTPSQKHKLAGVVDRIVEDTTRRKQGEFFTPTIWVNKAHEYIASVYGEDWKEKYGQTLIAVGTTSLYGIHSQYNGIPHFKTLGESAGKVATKPDDSVYEPWHHWIKENKSEQYAIQTAEKEGVDGPATGVKQKVINMIFKELGLKGSHYQHGFKRGVYFAQMYENGNEFLRNEIAEDQLIMKDKFVDSDEYTMKWWKPKAMKRYEKLHEEGRIKPESLFYLDIIGMSWEDCKEKYLKEVGR